MCRLKHVALPWPCRVCSAYFKDGARAQHVRYCQARLVTTGARTLAIQIFFADANSVMTRARLQERAARPATGSGWDVRFVSCSDDHRRHAADQYANRDVWTVRLAATAADPSSYRHEAARAPVRTTVERVRREPRGLTPHFDAGCSSPGTSNVPGALCRSDSPIFR